MKILIRFHYDPGALTARYCALVVSATIHVVLTTPATILIFDQNDTNRRRNTKSAVEAYWNLHVRHLMAIVLACSKVT